MGEIGPWVGGSLLFEAVADKGVDSFDNTLFKVDLSLMLVLLQDFVHESLAYCIGVMLFSLV